MKGRLDLSHKVKIGPGPVVARNRQIIYNSFKIKGELFEWSPSETRESTNVFLNSTRKYPLILAAIAIFSKINGFARRRPPTPDKCIYDPNRKLKSSHESKVL